MVRMLSIKVVTYHSLDQLSRIIRDGPTILVLPDLFYCSLNYMPDGQGAL